jgi:hypothetical protein
VSEAPHAFGPTPARATLWRRQVTSSWVARAAGAGGGPLGPSPGPNWWAPFQISTGLPCAAALSGFLPNSPVRQRQVCCSKIPKPKTPFQKKLLQPFQKKHNSRSDQNQSILSFTKFIKILIILTCMISNRYALNIRFNDGFNDIYFSRVVPFYINLIKPYILNIPLL